MWVFFWLWGNSDKVLDRWISYGCVLGWFLWLLTWFQKFFRTMNTLCRFWSKSSLEVLGVFQNPMQKPKMNPVLIWSTSDIIYIWDCVSCDSFHNITKLDSAPLFKKRLQVSGVTNFSLSSTDLLLLEPQ